MSDLVNRVTDRVKGSVNFGGWTTEHPERPAGMWTLHNVMGFYHAVKVHEAIDQTMPLLSEVDKGQDWTIWRSQKLTVRFRREGGEVWIDFLRKVGDDFPKLIEPWKGAEPVTKNLKLRRAKALLKCRGHRLSGRCQTAPAYNNEGAGRGACGSCSLFVDIRAADIAEGKVMVKDR